jgi:hypothetical protein
MPDMSKRNIFKSFSDEKELQQDTGEKLAQVLLRLDEFASWVNVGGFDRGLKELVTGEPTDSVLVVSEAASLSLSRGLSGTQRDVVVKSLQETFMLIVEGDPDITASEFAFILQRFTKRLGSRGLLRLFLSSYTFNLIWSQSGDSFAAKAKNASDLKKSSQEIEQRCQATADVVLQRCDKWLGQDQAAAMAIVRGMVSRLANKKAGDS